MTRRPRRAVFVDRDGTIVEERHYLRTPDEVCLVPGAAEALRRFRRAGFLLFVVSNQSGLGRGLIAPGEHDAVHRRFLELLAAESVLPDDVRYCPHTPEAQCGCRKPATGLLPADWNGELVDWRRSVVIGDKPSDLLLAENAKASGYLVLSGHGRASLDAAPELFAKYPVYPTLFEVAKALTYLRSDDDKWVEESR
jgi:D-glycero-D-manno-heptose 1,7-bisphosphate phosphatase